MFLESTTCDSSTCELAAFALKAVLSSLRVAVRIAPCCSYACSASCNAWFNLPAVWSTALLGLAIFAPRPPMCTQGNKQITTAGDSKKETLYTLAERELQAPTELR